MRNRSDFPRNVTKVADLPAAAASKRNFTPSRGAACVTGGGQRARGARFRLSAFPFSGAHQVCVSREENCVTHFVRGARPPARAADTNKMNDRRCEKLQSGSLMSGRPTGPVASRAPRHFGRTEGRKQTNATLGRAHGHRRCLLSVGKGRIN